MGLPKEIEDRITQFATRCFSRGEIGARNSDPSRERDALVSAITHALAERDARIAELEEAAGPISQLLYAIDHDYAAVADDTRLDQLPLSLKRLTVGDLRRARALLAKGGGK